MKENEVFKTLSAINVNDKTKKKNGLTYLSWAWAWEQVKANYPDATYKVMENEQGMPYFESPLGFMCKTQLTIEDEMLPMWLPVLDGANKTIKTEEYIYQVKDWDASKTAGKTMFKDKSVAAINMFDINTTIMRCLVKNIAVFGLGLYIYAGEDLPTGKPMLTEEQYKKTLIADVNGIHAVLAKFEMSDKWRRELGEVIIVMDNPMEQ